MVKYKIKNCKTKWKEGWVNSQLSQGMLGYCKNEKKAKEFYDDEEKFTEDALAYWEMEYEKIGESEPREKKVEKEVRVRRGKS